MWDVYPSAQRTCAQPFRRKAQYTEHRYYTEFRGGISFTLIIFNSYCRHIQGLAIIRSVAFELSELNAVQFLRPFRDLIRNSCTTDKLLRIYRSTCIYIYTLFLQLVRISENLIKQQLYVITRLQEFNRFTKA